MGFFSPIPTEIKNPYLNVRQFNENNQPKVGESPLPVTSYRVEPPSTFAYPGDYTWIYTCPERTRADILNINHSASWGQTDNAQHILSKFSYGQSNLYLFDCTWEYSITPPYSGEIVNYYPFASYFEEVIMTYLTQRTTIKTKTLPNRILNPGDSITVYHKNLLTDNDRPLTFVAIQEYSIS